MNSKENLLEEYITEYTPENRLGFCKLVRKKYRFENYRMSVKFEDINSKDFIVQNPITLAKVDNVIMQGSCSKEEFKDIFNDLTKDQIIYIGF
jgi:hypothetical protein